MSSRTHNLIYPQRGFAENEANQGDKSNFDFEKCSVALESGAFQTAVIVINAPDNETITLTNSDIFKDGLQIDKKLSANDSTYPIGQSASTAFSLKILPDSLSVSPYDLYNCTLTITIYVNCGETFNRDVYKGMFVINDVDVSDNYITLSGLDYMCFLNFSYKDLVQKPRNGTGTHYDPSPINWTNVTYDSSTQQYTYTLFTPKQFVKELARRTSIYYWGYTDNDHIAKTLPYFSKMLNYTDDASQFSFFYENTVYQTTITREFSYPYYAPSNASTATISELLSAFLGLHGYNLFVDDTGALNMSHLNVDNPYSLDHFTLTPAKTLNHKFYSQSEKMLNFPSTLYVRYFGSNKNTLDYILQDNPLLANAPTYSTVGNGVGSWTDPVPFYEVGSSYSGKNCRIYTDQIAVGNNSILGRTISGFEADILPAPYLSPDDYILLQFDGHNYNTYITSVSFTLNGATHISCDVKQTEQNQLIQ